VASTDGQWQFTVYARANKGAFIHALMMDGQISLCLELPGSGWNTDPSVFRWSLALSPAGTRLYATNGALGLVVEVEAAGQNAPAILRTQSIPKGPLQAPLPMGAGAAVVSPDGHVLAVAGGAGVEWVDVDRMRVTASALPSWTVWGVGVSPDGQSLYALKDSGQIAELSPDGVVMSMFDPKNGTPMALMRVEAP
jgi:DNA-binding beta-propeller fold protein YncE